MSVEVFSILDIFADLVVRTTWSYSGIYGLDEINISSVHNTHTYTINCMPCYHEISCLSDTTDGLIFVASGMTSWPLKSCHFESISQGSDEARPDFRALGRLLENSAYLFDILMRYAGWSKIFYLACLRRSHVRVSISRS